MLFNFVMGGMDSKVVGNAENALLDKLTHKICWQEWCVDRLPRPSNSDGYWC